MAQEEESHELLQAQGHVWNLTYGNINSMSLKCTIQPCIPDIIDNHAQTITLSELAALLPISPTKTTCLQRLLRLLVHLKLFCLLGIEFLELWTLPSYPRGWLKLKIKTHKLPLENLSFGISHQLIKTYSILWEMRFHLRLHLLSFTLYLFNSTASSFRKNIAKYVTKPYPFKQFLNHAKPPNFSFSFLIS